MELHKAPFSLLFDFLVSGLDLGHEVSLLITVAGVIKLRQNKYLKARIIEYFGRESSRTYLTRISLTGINISSCTGVKETTVEESNNGDNGLEHREDWWINFGEVRI